MTFLVSPSLLGSILAADFNSTADQVIVIKTSKYIVRRITATNASMPLTLATGGIYTGASKTGTVVVAAAQPYTGLTTGSKYLDLVLSNVTDILTSASMLLSLTVPQGVLATADVYVYGDVIS